MKRIAWLVAGILALHALSASALRGDQRSVPGEVLIRVHPTFTRTVQSKTDQPSIHLAKPLQSSLKGLGLLSARPLNVDSGFPSTKTLRRGGFPGGGLFLLTFDRSHAGSHLVDQVRSLAGILHAEPNYIGTLSYVPGDELYLQTADHFARLGLEDAWDVQQGGDSSVIVAVIDSGLDAQHIDLDDALHPGSYNFVDDNDVVFDDLGHGTRVAGILAAEGNNDGNAGIAGIAFGAQILSCDVVDASGILTTARTIQAIDHAVAQGARVINMSFQFYAESQFLREACDDASQHTVLVASSGNENQGDTPVYPASYDSVTGVGATMLDSDERAPFSNYNGTEDSLVDLVAPGVNIFTTIPGSAYDGNYTSGSSFAAPMVSGVAALLQSRYPGQSAEAIASHLKATAVPVGTWAGFGRLSAKDALGSEMAPQLSVASVDVDDSAVWGAGNDEDGRWDAGETVRLFISLSNAGADAQDVTGTLSTSDPDVILTDASTAWGAIASGETKEAIDANENASVTVDADAHTVAFDMTVSSRVVTSTGVAKYEDMLAFTVPIEKTFTPPTIIATDTTWTADKTYVIEANTVVMPSATLTIEPGTTLRFGPEGGLEVRGGIAAEGAEHSKITFTSLDGTPGGGVEPPISITAGNRPWDVTVGDADNDGDNDIVASNLYNSSLSLVRWNGAGFDPALAIPVESSPSSVGIADADNDGYLDIIAAHGYAGSVSFVRWNGSHFDPFVNMPVGDKPDPGSWEMALGDADNDGYTDIITANGYLGSVSVIRWNGAGFDPQVSLSCGGERDSSFWVTIGDADNDGDNDMVTANRDSQTISLIRWNGSGFDPFVKYPLGCSAKLNISDINGDGLEELILGGDVYLWNGIGFSLIGNIDVYDFRAARDRYPSITNGQWSGWGGVFVGDADNDGYNDILTVDDVVWISRYSSGLAQDRAYKGLWLRSTSIQAGFSHCSFQFAPLLDESVVAAFSDCTFDRTGEGYSLSTLGGSNALLRCVVKGNQGGNGILAGSKALNNCRAEDNKGVGVSGGNLAHCLAEKNGSIGLSGASILDCTSSENGGNGISGTTVLRCISIRNNRAGIVASGLVGDCLAVGNSEEGIATSGNVENSIALRNGAGISGVNVTDCTAESNCGVGIAASGQAVGCRALDNSGIGLSGSSFMDCSVVGNDSGLNASGHVQRSLVAENTADGITGGSLFYCSVHHNTGNGVVNPSSIDESWIVSNKGIGIVSPSSVSNSWVLDNGSTGIHSPGSVADSYVAASGGFGVLGKLGPPYSEINGSSIVDNLGGGVQSSGTMNDSNLYGNGDGYDYKETRSSSELSQVDVTGNYWGPQTTLEMNDHPWGIYYNIARIYDFVDDTNLCEAKYANHLGAPITVGLPSVAAPAFLLSVTPNLANAVNVGLASFTLAFSEPMDPAVAPVVTFDTTTPYTGHFVQPVGWLDDVTWQGTFAIGNDTGDGLNTLRVSNAFSDDGFLIPDDTAHQFVIDTKPGTGTLKGVATPLGYDSMQLTWDPSPQGNLLGYTIVRSLSLGGPYHRVHSVDASVNECIDTELSGGTTYYYQIYEYDSSFNSRQLTAPFFATTQEPLTPTPSYTPTNTPTVTATPTVTPTPEMPDFTGDNRVDAADLLRMIKALRNDETGSYDLNGDDVSNYKDLFLFSRWWWNIE